MSKPCPGCNESRARKPRFPTGHLYLGVALYALADLRGAETEFLKVLELNPEGEARALMFLGNLYYLQGKLPEAIESFESYLEKLPEAPNADQVRLVLKDLKRQVKG